MLEMITGSLLKKITEPEVFEKLLATDGANNDNFGYSVAASNTTVAVGAYRHLGKGAVYVF